MRRGWLRTVLVPVLCVLDGVAVGSVALRYVETLPATAIAMSVSLLAVVAAILLGWA